MRIVILGSFFFAVLSLPFTIGSSSTPQDKPVEVVSKNIQVLKGLPESQLLPVMHLMRTSLGVRCDYCHIAENGKYWMDDKPAKETARRMIQMVLDLNKANFAGEPVISCNTCHRGSTKPLGVPPLGQAAFQNTTRAEPGENVSERQPGVDEIFTKYVDAIGGKRALEGIQTRVTEASLMRPRLVNPSGKPLAVETYQKAPNKLLTLIKSPDGSVTYQGFNGKVGWVKTPTLQREMTTSELAQVRQQADLYKELTLKNQLSTLKVTGKQKVGEREAYVVEGMNSANRTERLFFDAENGLFVRRIVLNRTMLGFVPVQTDFSDYREVDGVKLPFTIQISYLDNNHYGTTRKFAQIRQNVPVDDAKFEMPSK